MRLHRKRSVRRGAQVPVVLSEDNRDAVSAAVEKAAHVGGKIASGGGSGFGFMHGRSVEDPDRPIWDVMWMDPTAGPPHAE